MAVKAKKKRVQKKRQPNVSAEEKRRKDWETNNELISEAFFTAVVTHKKFPTYESLAKKLKLDERTVRRHLGDDEMFQDLKVKLRALKNKALLTLAIKAIKGDSHHWSRLFFEVTDEVKEKDQNITININGKKVS
jgi:hypothetical protein